MTGTERTASVDIESIAAGGDGVGRVGGQVVFVPRTAPGDRVRIRYVAGTRFAHATLLEVERPSPMRVVPRCAHYVEDQCGGCQLQHLNEEAQQTAKATIVRDALTRIARRPLDTVPLRAGTHPWHYRRKLTLALRRRDSGWIAGLHRLREPETVFSLRECPITAEPVVDTWRAVMRSADRLPDAAALRGAIQAGEDGFALVLEGGSAWPTAAELQAAVPELNEIWWAPEGKRPTRLVPRDGPQSVGASFAQVNPDVAALLHAYVVERTLTYRPETVIDAYAGLGATALPLARQGMRVTAIEIDRVAVDALSAQLPAGSRALAGRVETALPRALPADVVLLNPPRSGVDAAVTSALETAARHTAAIIYVSCDPATLARDVARLPSYRIAKVQSFDMFPQTAHVETVCELVR